MGRGGEFELKEETKILNVNLDDRTCDCKGWQISEVPCNHVLACILVNRLEVLDYIHTSYLKTMYLRTYTYIIYLIPNQDSWPEVGYDAIQPSQVKRQPCKPKLSRRRGVDEDPNPKAYAVKCGKCKEYGHNQRTWKVLKHTNTIVTNEAYVDIKSLFILSIFIYFCSFNHYIACTSYENFSFMFDYI